MNLCSFFANMFKINVEKVLNTSKNLEESGNIVLALSLVQGLCGLETLLPQELVRLRVRAADLMETYTNNHEQARLNLVNAIHLLDGQTSSVSFNSMRISLHLRLAESHARTEKDLHSSWRELEAANKIAKSLNLTWMVPRVHLVRFHLFTLEGNRANAESALDSTEECAKSEGMFHICALVMLIRAHIRLQEGQVQQARDLLVKAKVCVAENKESCTQSCEKTMQPVLAQGMDVISEDPEGRNMFLEIEEYLDLLEILLCICTSDFSFFNPNSSFIKVSKKLGSGGCNPACNSRPRSLRWISDRTMLALGCYVESIQLQRRAAVPFPHIVQEPQKQEGIETNDSANQGSIEAVMLGLQHLGIRLDKNSSSENHQGGGFLEGDDWMIRNESDASTFGFQPIQSRHAIAFLLVERLCSLRLLRTELAEGLESLTILIQVHDLMGVCPKSAPFEEASASLHMIIAQYLRRVDDLDGALRHLAAVEDSAVSSATRAVAALHRAVILLDSPEGLEQSVREAGSLCDAAWVALRGGESGGPGEAHRCWLLYLKARILLKFHSDDADKRTEAMHMLEVGSEEASRKGMDGLVQVQLQGLLGNAMLAQGLVEEGLKKLGGAHLLVKELGDMWAEVGILRSLERGYLLLPERRRVAKASFTIQASRCRALEARKCTALQQPFHGLVASWGIPTVS